MVHELYRRLRRRIHRWADTPQVWHRLYVRSAPQVWSPFYIKYARFLLRGLFLSFVQIRARSRPVAIIFIVSHHNESNTKLESTEYCQHFVTLHFQVRHFSWILITSQTLSKRKQRVLAKAYLACILKSGWQKKKLAVKFSQVKRRNRPNIREEIEVLRPPGNELWTSS